MQLKPNLFNFTFQLRKKLALSLSALKKTKTLPIFSLKNKNACTTKLKRIYANSLAKNLQVNI
jgi:hypothetical protein